MKINKRLDYSNLASVLGQRGLVEPDRLSMALNAGVQGPVPFPELLVAESLIGDWELSQVACEIYGLPFVSTDVYDPDPEAFVDLDIEFLRQHRLIPLCRHGQVLTVCMPALVPADVLGTLASSADLQILPVVGTVALNGQWIEERLDQLVGSIPAKPGAEGRSADKPTEAGDSPEIAESKLPKLDLPPAIGSGDSKQPASASERSKAEADEDAVGPALPSGDGWVNIFDLGNAAVLMDIEDRTKPEPG